MDCQLPKPKGAKIGATKPPMAANKDLSISSTMVKDPSTIPKALVNQMIMLERRMIVPARLMKDQPRSQVPRSTLTTVGTW